LETRRATLYGVARAIHADAKTFAAIDIFHGENYVDLVWGSARPDRPKNPLFSLDVKYAGESHTGKHGNVRQEMDKQNACAFVVTMLDEVAWLLNLCGSDIDFNPVFFAYAVVSADDAQLFVDPAQLSQDVRAQLGQEVQLRPYDEFIPYLKQLGTGLQEGQKVLVGDKARVAIAEALGYPNITIARSPIADLNYQECK